MLGTNEPRPENLHALGLAGWAVVLGLGLAWEGFGLVFAREHWPSMSDLLRGMSRPLAGRWLLLALWIWLGWHLFVRGWHPLLSGPPPSGGQAVAALSFDQILHQVVVPLGLAYAAVLATMARSRRPAAHGTASTNPQLGAGGDAPPGAVSLVRHVVLTLAAGYVAFVVLVVSYYAWVANQTPQFVRAAASGGAFITFAVAVPGMLLLSGANALRRRRRAA
jgi:hypothetical protein